MGLLQRVSDVLKSNINRILDQAEDPEMVLDALVHEMQESYRKSKIEVAKALADEKRLKHLMQTNQDMASKWGRKAVLAVEKNDDDLAREALKRKRSYEDIAREFEVQWTEQKKVTDVLRENLFGLESKIDEARRKKSLLAARQKRVLAQKKLQDTLEQATSEQTYLTMGRFEEKITEIEARAEAEIDILDNEFDGRFRDLENRGENIEDELTALKHQVGGQRSGEQKLLATEGHESAGDPKPGSAGADLPAMSRAWQSDSPSGDEGKTAHPESQTPSGTPDAVLDPSRAASRNPAEPDSALGESGASASQVTAVEPPAESPPRDYTVPTPPARRMPPLDMPPAVEVAVEPALSPPVEPAIPEPLAPPAEPHPLEPPAEPHPLDPVAPKPAAEKEREWERFEGGI